MHVRSQNNQEGVSVGVESIVRIPMDANRSRIDELLEEARRGYGDEPKTVERGGYLWIDVKDTLIRDRFTESLTNAGICWTLAY